MGFWAAIKAVMLGATFLVIINIIGWKGAIAGKFGGQIILVDGVIILGTVFAALNGLLAEVPTSPAVMKAIDFSGRSALIGQTSRLAREEARISTEEKMRLDAFRKQLALQAPEE